MRSPSCSESGTPPSQPDEAETAPSGLAHVCRWAARAALASAIVFFLVNCWLLRDLKIDDSFITYRFGARLVHDGTLRWNMLEPPVEGYTSFLAVLISGLFEIPRLDPLLAWKALSVVLVFWGAAIAGRGARVFCSAYLPQANEFGLPLLIAALCCANPLAAVHAMSGMETTLFAFGLIALTAVAYRLVFVPESSPILFAVLGAGFLLLGLTRPEGVLWACVVAPAVWFGLPGERRPLFARCVLFCFVFPGAIYLAARWVYFGDLLSATFHAKTASAARPGAGRLLTYLPSHHEVYKYLRDNWLAFGVVATVAAGAHFARGRRRGGIPIARASQAVFVGALVLASALCIGYFSSVYMLMGYARRFLFPFGQTFLLTLVLPAIVMTAFFARWRGPTGAASVAGRLLFFLFALALLLCFAQTGRAVYRDSKQAFGLLANNNRRLDGYARAGRALDAVAQRVGRQLTLFHHNMGELMYFAPHWNSIDPVGLVDRHVSRRGFSVDYAFSRNPEVFILPSMSKTEITSYAAELFPDISRAAYDDARMRRYKYLGYFPDLPFGAEGRMHFLVRRDLLGQYPWIEDFLTHSLNLRIEPRFRRAE